MIAVCPKCKARYRVDADQIAPTGAKLRCSQCSALFLVRAPEATAAKAARTPTPAIAPPTAAPAHGGRLVVVADPDEERGKTSVEALRRWGLSAHLVHDGVEAMLAIQRMLPEVVVLDAALPRMYGFQVCEVVKRNASLKGISVVLVGSVHDPSRYRRDPSDLYGADVYLEQPDLPDGLRPIFERRGLLTPRSASAPAPIRMRPPPAAPAPTVPAPAAVPAAEPTAIASTTTASAAPSDPGRDEERERARRLARIAVSEMVLYQPEKFARACQDGTLERALEVEIQEARALIRQRIGPEVRGEADFVLEELNRVARERGGRA